MITKSFDGRTIILVFENGVDGKGNPVFVKKSIFNVAEGTTSEQVHEIGSKLALLYSLPLSKIMVDEDFVLSI